MPDPTPASSPDDLTRFLTRLGAQDQEVDPARMAHVYGELKAIAVAEMRRQRPDHTLQPTALVNAAYLKLFQGEGQAWRSRGHFYALAAKAMRQVLVDHARSRATAKRGGDRRRVPFVALEERPSTSISELLDIDAALTELAELDPRQAEVVELRYFGGLEVAEVAEALGVSASTVEREWRAARAWLTVRLADRSR